MGALKMKKNGIVILVTLLFIMLFTVGCSNDDKDAFLKYRNEDMKQTAEYEQEFLKSYSSVTEPNFKNYPTLLAEFKDNTLAITEKWLKAAETVKSDLSTINESHKLYVDNIKEIQKSINMSVEGIEDDDSKVECEGLIVYDKAKNTLAEYHTKMDKLDKKYGVKK